MNYGIIPAIIANNDEERRSYTETYGEIGISTDRIISAYNSVDIMEQLKAGDALIVLCNVNFCHYTTVIMGVMEQVLSKGITLGFYNRNIYIIQPDELPMLQSLVKRLSGTK